MAGGLHCRHSDQRDGRLCLNYQVRLKCGTPPPDQVCRSLRPILTKACIHTSVNVCLSMCVCVCVCVCVICMQCLVRCAPSNIEVMKVGFDFIAGPPHCPRLGSCSQSWVGVNYIGRVSLGSTVLTQCPWVNCIDLVSPGSTVLA